MEILRLPKGYRHTFEYYDYRENIKYIPIGYPYLVNKVYREQLLTSGIKDIAKKIEVADEDFKKHYAATVAGMKKFKYYTKPMRPQKESLFVLLLYKKYGLFDDMGTGKTKVYLDLVKYTGGQFLILTEAHLISNIVKVEAKKHRPDLNIVGYQASMTPNQKKRLWERVEQGASLVINYENINKFQDILLSRKWTGLILDESANSKNYDLDRTQILLNISEKCEYVVPATGTPSLGKSLDVFPQMLLISKYIFSSNYHIFKRKYCAYKAIRVPDRFGNLSGSRQVYAGPKNVAGITRRISFFYIRHMKNPKDYPERMEIPMYLPSTSEQETLYKDFKQGKLKKVYCYDAYPALQKMKSLEIAGGHLTLPTQTDFESCDQIGCKIPECYGFFNAANCIRRSGKIRKYDQETFYFSTEKEKALKTLLKQSMDSGRTCLVFYEFKADLVVIKKVLKNLKGYKFPVLHLGECSKKIESLEKFKTGISKSSPGVVTAQNSSGIGWTFTEASVCIYYSVPYFGDYAQSRDRVYRKGQTQNVTNYILLSPLKEEHSKYKCMLEGRDFLQEIMKEK